MLSQMVVSFSKSFRESFSSVSTATFAKKPPRFQRFLSSRFLSLYHFRFFCHPCSIFGNRSQFAKFQGRQQTLKKRRKNMLQFTIVHQHFTEDVARTKNFVDLLRHRCKRETYSFIFLEILKHLLKFRTIFPKLLF